MQGFARNGYGWEREGRVCACIKRRFISPVFSCRWNEAFQKEGISSRLETTHMMATAIAKAPQPPQAWVLVTGVGMPQVTNPLDQPGKEGCTVRSGSGLSAGLFQAQELPALDPCIFLLAFVYFHEKWRPSKKEGGVALFPVPGKIPPTSKSLVSHSTVL